MDKLCPLKFVVKEIPPNVDARQLGEWNCEEHKCAWWIIGLGKRQDGKINGECVLQRIASRIGNK